ncbi:MAG: SigB/SigF/SigG family polymerase sigma factor [Armatimonadetes bacterium]|jgi:RNA polymerase sigma-B factor|nr:SigB/SigF/SigG family polymerase sigma factor [Armatimonadota bacterium]
MTQQELDNRTADRLWADYAQTHDPRTREALIHQFERLAYSIANRYLQRGVESEDVCQVARMGLVKAVDRFDPSTNFRFSTFATPTILGEIRRYFRDHSRPVHVPRGVQELAVRVERAGRELTRRLGRQPSAGELASSLDVTEERVQEVLRLDEATHPLSLDCELDSGELADRNGDLAQCLGGEDAGLQEAEHRVSLGQALRHLAEPLREIIRMRYFAGLSQREVARQLGMSQMQIGRLEKRALAQLRGQFAVH